MALDLHRTPPCRRVEPNEGREKEEEEARRLEPASAVTRTETGRCGPLLPVVVARGKYNPDNVLRELLVGEPA